MLCQKKNECAFLVLKVQVLTVKNMECFHLLSTSGNCNKNLILSLDRVPLKGGGIATFQTTTH